MTTPFVDLIIKGGQVVTATDVIDAAVAITDGTIAAIGPERLLPPAERIIDATGKYVLPGLIDCHLHLGPENDNWQTGPLAAARTGLTTLIPFVIYEEGETLEQAFKRLREEAEAASVLDFGFHMILNHDPHMLDGIPALVRQGVRSFKLFMTYKKRGRRMVSDEFICKVMERLAPLDGLCQLHCESGDVIAYLEDKAINRAVLIGRMLDCPVYVVHLSTRLGLERIKRAQSEGQRVWTETCPQYLLLTDEAMERWGPFAKIG